MKFPASHPIEQRRARLRAATAALAPESNARAFARAAEVPAYASAKHALEAALARFVRPQERTWTPAPELEETPLARAMMAARQAFHILTA